MAKTKALISCAVNLQLICVFVFAYAKSRFSHNEAHFVNEGSDQTGWMCSVVHMALFNLIFKTHPDNVIYAKG